MTARPVQHGAGVKLDPPQVDPNRCQGYAGDITPIVSRLDESIRIVVSGHTHRYYTCALPNARGTSLVTICS